MTYSEKEEIRGKLLAIVKAERDYLCALLNLHILDRRLTKSIDQRLADIDRNYPGIFTS